MAKKSSQLSKILPFFFSVGAVIVFAVYISHNFAHYRQLLHLSIGSTIFLAGLALGSLFCSGIINYSLYRNLGVSLPFSESFGLASVNTLANQLPFAGGIVAKGVYLKRQYNLPYTRFLSATVALYACFIAANGVIGVAIITLLTVNGVSVPTLLKMGFAAMTASVLLFWLPVDIKSLSDKWRKRFKQLGEGWQVLSQNQALLFELVGVQIITTLVAAGRFWIAFHVLSQDVTYAQCLLFAAATVLTRLINIAPGGLGVREGIVAAVASLLGFEAGISAVAVSIDRLVATSVIVVLGTIYTYVLSKKVADTDQVDSTISEE